MTWARWNIDEVLLDIFHGNCPRRVLGVYSTNRISNSKLYDKYGSILLSEVIMRERLELIGHVLQMKEERLPKIVFFSHPSRAKRKQDRPKI